MVISIAGVAGHRAEKQKLHCTPPASLRIDLANRLPSSVGYTLADVRGATPPSEGPSPSHTVLQMKLTLAMVLLSRCTIIEVQAALCLCEGIAIVTSSTPGSSLRDHDALIKIMGTMKKHLHSENV